MAYESSEMSSSGGTGSSMPQYPEGTSAEEIRRDISRTRSEIGQTVDALQERLRPRHLLDDVMDMFRKSSSGSSSGSSGSLTSESFSHAGSKVLEKLKENPMPAALIGAGIAWLMFEGDKRGRTRADYQPRKWDVPSYSGSYVDARTGQPYAADYGHEQNRQTGDSSQESSGPGMMQRAKETIGSAAESVKDAVTGAARSAKDATSSAAGRMSEWGGAARDSAGNAGGMARGYASDMSHRMQHGMQSGKHYVERGIEDYPLAMGAAALAIGMLSGLLLPHTQTEDRLMGEKADELKDQVKDAGKQAVEAGKQVASAAASGATSAAGDQDIRPGSLAEKVKHVVQDVKEAATESARREGLDPQSLAHKGQQVAERAKEAAAEEARRQKDQARSSM